VISVRRQLLTILGVATLVVAACGSGTATPTVAPTVAPTAAPPESVAPTTAPASVAPETTAPEGFLARAMAGEFKGTTVTATGPFVDEDAVKFNASIKAFEDATGIDIDYAGTKEFEATISARVDAADAPDIVDFPQPGLLANFAKSGKVIDLSKYLDMATLQKQYNQSWLDMGTMASGSDTILAGIFDRVNGKSFVWYPKKAFDAAGYTVPTTWDELVALQDQIVADGDTPWCIGIESGAATGWPVTDWLEEMMLRTTSLENYDKWITNELKFSSPEVKNAATKVGDIFLNDALVNGGRAGIVTTNFGDAPKAMFTDPPKCWLHRQGNFITSFFPADAKPGVDYDVFYLPGIDPQYGSPVLVAGDIWAAFKDRPEVMAVMEYFTKGEHLKVWVQSGGAIAPQLDTDLTWYGDDITRFVAQTILEADSVRFDASDLMPGAVGSGAEWKEFTSWISGKEDLDTALKNIDAAWPK
jgi:alpha-glucoside transport system substrate-binding protein